jgi:hypothetical protein
LALSTGVEKIAALTPIPWDRVGERVYVARWRAVCAQNTVWLRTFTPDTMPAGRLSMAKAACLLPGVSTNDAKALVGVGVSVLGAALSLLLLDEGWTLRTGPGEPFALVRGDEKLCAFEVVAGLADGSVRLHDWQRRCELLGLSGKPLSKSATPGGGRAAG